MAIPSKLFFEKVYVRENSLMAYQLLDDHGTKAIINTLNWVTPYTLFDVTQNSATIYYRSDVFPGFEKQILEKNPEFVKNLMIEFGEVLDIVQPIWKAKKPLKNLKELIDFYYHSIQCWCGVDVAYFAPEIKVSEKDKKLAMDMRLRSVDFLEDTDHIFQLTLRKLFPQLGDLIKYLTFDEVRDGNIPSLKELKARSKQYVYYEYKIYTNTPLSEFAKNKKLLIHQEKPKSNNQVNGQIAMKGLVRGKVRVLTFKNEIPLLKKDEILITSMTTPDYLPAMHKAAAFVTDEGGITCHAAIVARELGKPCVIGTKFATQVFKTGDLVEVDANNGIIKLIK